MRYIISLALLLSLLWLGLSGVYKPLLLALGAGSVVFVVWMSRRMDMVGIEHNPILYSWRLPVYWAWLSWQIIKANIEVSIAAIGPAGRVKPQLVEVPVKLGTAVAKVTYANSVTLTPGTVSLLLDPDRLEVHALLQSTADDLESGTMEKWVAWLEKRS
ncbi:MAG: Na+/H+ antiporter subunit E [Wenzhouxiangellaceae bacterium]|nr:Na+/H+ antiporter subunit E [Wenzhouxiangellaceae bacterium]